MATKKAPARPGRRREAFTGWTPVRRPDWRDGALCAGRDTEAFFPDDDRPAIIAKSICRRCPVRSDCLAHAIEHRERYGIWGGFTEHARALLVARVAERNEVRFRAQTGGDDGPVPA
jgi:WhiB family redox-sensing transcriptional regulator